MRKRIDDAKAKRAKRLKVQQDQALFMRDAFKTKQQNHSRSHDLENIYSTNISLLLNNDNRNNCLREVVPAPLHEVAPPNMKVNYPPSSIEAPSTMKDNYPNSSSIFQFQPATFTFRSLHSTIDLAESISVDSNTKHELVPNHSVTTTREYVEFSASPRTDKVPWTHHFFGLYFNPYRSFNFFNKTYHTYNPPLHVPWISLVDIINTMDSFARKIRKSGGHGFIFDKPEHEMVKSDYVHRGKARKTPAMVGSSTSALATNQIKKHILVKKIEKIGKTPRGIDLLSSNCNSPFFYKGMMNHFGEFVDEIKNLISKKDFHLLLQMMDRFVQRVYPNFHRHVMKVIPPRYRIYEGKVFISCWLSPKKKGTNIIFILFCCFVLDCIFSQVGKTGGTYAGKCEVHVDENSEINIICQISKLGCTGGNTKFHKTRTSTLFESITNKHHQFIVGDFANQYHSSTSWKGFRCCIGCYVAANTLKFFHSHTFVPGSKLTDPLNKQFKKSPIEEVEMLLEEYALVKKELEN